MKKMMMIGIYGLVILGASAGGTWFLRQKDIEAQQAEADKVEPMPDSIADLAAPVDVTKPLEDPKDAPKEKELPVAVRPEEMSVEEIVRYGLGLRKREAAIHEREEALRRTETQHRLVLADIDGDVAIHLWNMWNGRSDEHARSQLLRYCAADVLLLLPLTQHLANVEMTDVENLWSRLPNTVAGSVSENAVQKRRRELQQKFGTARPGKLRTLRIRPT